MNCNESLTSGVQVLLSCVYSTDARLICVGYRIFGLFIFLPKHSQKGFGLL